MVGLDLGGGGDSTEPLVSREEKKSSAGRLRVWLTVGLVVAILAAVVTVVILHQKDHGDPPVAQYLCGSEVTVGGAPFLGSPALPARALLIHDRARTQGNWEDARGGQLAAFRGIQFAQQARFQPPSPVSPCSAGLEIDAKDNGPACWQAGGQYFIPQAEDCLFLNVFSYDLPRRGSAPQPGVPVIVWIHGGYLLQGSAIDYETVENLAEPGRAVVVAIQYRLSVFGWLALRELSEADPRGVSGNLGLLDQQVALQWVQQHISAFGGDPRRVTLLGQSSGGTSILMHFASPGSAHLFAAGISLSGSPNMTMNLATAEAANRGLVLPATPCLNDSNVRDCLLRMPAEQLSRASPSQWFGPADDFPHSASGAGWPGIAIVDGVTVPRPLLEAVAIPTVDAALVVQGVSAEDAFEPKSAVDSWTVSSMQAYVNASLSAVTADPNAPSEVEALYSASLAPVGFYYHATTDVGVQCGSVAVAVAAARAFASAVYVSEVAATPSHPWVQDNGLATPYAFHCFDYCAAAETWDLMNAEQPFDPRASDLALGALLREQWWTIASDLSLDGAAKGVGWERVSPIAGSYKHGVIYSNGTVTVANYKTDVCAYWLSLGVDARFWWSN